MRKYRRNTSYFQKKKEAEENLLYRIQHAEESFRDASYAYEYALSEGMHEDLQELEGKLNYSKIQC